MRKNLVEAKAYRYHQGSEPALDQQSSEHVIALEPAGILRCDEQA